jgi:hypothetical protein
VNRCAGWATFDAENKPEALLSVPPFLRGSAQVVQLTRFQPEKVQAMHEK